MLILMTGPKDRLAYWAEGGSVREQSGFGIEGRLRYETKRSFARFSAFADNSNHAPTGKDGAITNEQGLDLLFRIAGAR